MNNDFDQLAAVLKSSGIVASYYDAVNMAKCISGAKTGASSSMPKASAAPVARENPVSGSSEQLATIIPCNLSSFSSKAVVSAPIEQEKEVERTMGAAEEAESLNAAQATETAILLQPDCATISQDREIQAPAGGNAAASVQLSEEAQAMEIAEDILREKEVESVEGSDAQAEMLCAAEVLVPEIKEARVDLDITSQQKSEPVGEKCASPAVAEPVATPAAPNAAEQMQQAMAAQMQKMMEEMMAKQAAQAAEMQKQIAEQQETIKRLMMQEQAAKEAADKKAAEAAKVIAAQPQPVKVEEPARIQQVSMQQPQRQQQVFSYPARNVEAKPSSAAFREVPIDRTKPKATLSREEQQATDITKWFNFSARKK